MSDNINWKNTKEGRMSIYYLTTNVVNSFKDTAYVQNDDAKIEDAEKIIDFLRQLIISEWMGD